MPETFGTVVFAASNSFVKQLKENSDVAMAALAELCGLPSNELIDYDVRYDRVARTKGFVCVNYSDAEWGAVAKVLSDSNTAAVFLLEGDEYGMYTYLSKAPEQDRIFFTVDSEGDECEDDLGLERKYQQYLDSIPSDVREKFPEITENVI